MHKGKKITILTTTLFMLFVVCFASTGVTIKAGGERTVVEWEILPALPKNPYWYNLSATHLGTNGVTYTSTNADVLVHDTVPSRYRRINLDVQRGLPKPGAFTLDPNATSTMRGDVMISSSVETVTVTCVSGGIERQATFEPTSITTAYSFVAGSLGEHMSTQVRYRVEQYGYDTNTQPLFVDAAEGWTATWLSPHPDWQAAHPEYSNLFNVAGSRTMIRNTNSWLRDVDLTCCSPWNSQLQNRKAGTLITEKHMVNAAHFGALPNGTTVLFIGNDNTVYSNTVAQSVKVDDGVGSDIQLYELTDVLPTNITPCAVLGAGWTNYFSMDGAGRDMWSAGVPVIWLDQMEIIRTTEFGQYPVSLNEFVAVSQDSGNPIFVVVNGSAALTTCFTTFSGGPAYYNWIDEINDQIAAWGGTQTVTVVDLSGFNEY